MNLIGIGTDIVAIERIERLWQSERFVQRLLHEAEIQRFAQLSTNQAAWLAKRFATKEAVSKALGTGIGAQVQLQEIETWHDALGKPQLRLHGRTLATAKRLGVTACSLSLADEKAYAVAFVILTGS